MFASIALSAGPVLGHKDTPLRIRTKLLRTHKQNIAMRLLAKYQLLVR